MQCSAITSYHRRSAITCGSASHQVGREARNLFELIPACVPYRIQLYREVVISVDRHVSWTASATALVLFRFKFAILAPGMGGRTV